MTDLDRLKNELNLADLVAYSHELLGQGRYRHGQKHDSLVIDTHHNAYWWNSKGESGDIIDWIGRYILGYEHAWSSSDPAMFKEAVRKLAQLAGQPEPAFKPEDPAQRQQRLDRQRLLDLAAAYYHDRFNASQSAQGYAHGRGFSPDTCQKFKLGHSDGNLIRLIDPADRQTALDLGLLAEKDGRIFDAIPAGCLVYPHLVRGRVSYFSGRTLAGKRHHNLYAPKEVFWAIPQGYGGDLVIVEGQADALSLAQWGLAAVALCGVNLFALDLEALDLFRRIYVIADRDPAGLAALDKLAQAISPLIRLVHLPAEQLDGRPIKDANDLLQAGFTAADDLANLLNTAKTYLDYAIEAVTCASEADFDDLLQKLFEHLARLDNFPLARYRAQVCRALSLNRADFDRYLAIAKNTVETENLFFKGEQYTVQEGWIIFKQPLQHGRINYIPLANASITITELIERDNGSGDIYREYLLEGQLAGGRDLPPCAVKTGEFPAMTWVAEHWPGVIIGAGRGIQDALREAIQHLSGDIPRRIIYEHLGWRQIDGHWTYLTAAGPLGLENDELKIEVDLRAGRPETHMNRYHLPTRPEAITDAILASLAFLNLREDIVTVPIFAAVYLAPLNPFVPVDFGLWLYGKSGSFKSVIAALALAHFGDWSGRYGKDKLPANFGSTANNILMNAFMAKDALLVIDDYAPGNTIREIRERDEVASRLLRSVGNRAARGRMKDGQRFQADYPPRCLALITAEDIPAGQSILARAIGVRVPIIPPEGTQDRANIEQRLRQAQNIDSALYPHALAAYILWIKRHWDHLADDLPALAVENQKRFSTWGHARLSDAFAKLMSALETALYFFQDAGAITDSQAQAHRARAFAALQQVMADHAGQIEALDPCVIFAETLREELDAQSWHLAAFNTLNAGDNDDSRPPLPYNTLKVGWQDDTYIYLLPKSVNAIIEAYGKRGGAPFPVGRNTLYSRLQEKGWLLKIGTEYIPAMSTSPHILKLWRSAIYPEES